MSTVTFMPAYTSQLLMIGRRAVLVLAVACLLVTAGCLGGLPSENGADADDGETANETATPEAGDRDGGETPDSDTPEADDTDDGTGPDADELLGAALDARESIDTVTGTMTVTSTSGEQSVTGTQEVWLRPPDEQRTELVEVEADAAGLEPTVTVTNGTVTWLYFEDENRVVRADHAQSSLGMAASALETQLQLDPSNLDATHDGTATVAGRDVHVVEFTADTEEATYDSGTLWIDRETNYPLKQEMTLSAGGEELTFEYEFEAVTFDEPIDDDVFAFDPPADAEVREFSELTPEQYDSIDDAEAAVPFDLPEPDLPEGYTFQTAIAGENIQGYYASLQYRNENGTSIMVTVSESATDDSPLFESEPVEIDGVNATITTPEDNVRIAWTDDELAYTVFGISVNGDLSEETVIEVAESIVE
ncbi:lipoprotein carrier protein LolA [Halobacteriales archaeon SW_10_66_29]|nr:MAG: lipoprotein carrier protein LolA [Halobacteriales archaeon SW_10_66_29]